MQNPVRIRLVGLVLAVGLSQAAPAAEEATQAAAVPGFDNPVAESELEGQRGRQGTTVIEITSATSELDGNVSDNVAQGNVSGANVIGEGAFNGLSGHASVIQNSGNNNVIQDSTIYNFSIRP